MKLTRIHERDMSATRDCRYVRLLICPCDRYVRTDARLFQKTKTMEIQLGQAVFHGRGGKTYSGIEFDVAKSMLQKHIRRGETEPALQIAMELWRTADLGKPGIQTNLMNRLAIIALEDIGIGPGNIDLVTAVVKHVLLSKGVRDLRMCATIYHCVEKLCAAPKTRLASFLYNAYARPEGQCWARRVRIRVDTTLIRAGAVNPNPPKHDLLQPLEAMLNPLGPKATQQSVAVNLNSRIDIAVHNIGFYLVHRDPHCIFWIDVLMRLIFENSTSPSGLLKPGVQSVKERSLVNYLWTILGTLGMAADMVDIYKNAFWERRNTKDARVFWLIPVIYRLVSKDARIGCRPALDFGEVARLQTDEKFLHLVHGELTPLTVPPYALDIHTSRGSRTGATSYDFAVETSRVSPEFVPPEDFPFDVANLKRAYVLTKAEETLMNPKLKLTFERRDELEELTGKRRPEGAGSAAKRTKVQ